MLRNFIMLAEYCCVIFLFCISILPANAAVYFADDFDGYSDSPANHGWGMGSLVTLEESGCKSETRCLRAHYNGDLQASGYEEMTHDPSPSEIFSEGYIRFSVKINNLDGNESSYGACKFLKLLGERDGGTNYSNITYNYDAQFFKASTGDGSTPSNDGTASYRYNGLNNGNGDVTYYYGFFNINDNQWHTFETYIKMNSIGNYDGAFTVWVDGIKRLEVINMRMAHDTNIRNYADMHIAGYPYLGSDKDWDIYIDDVLISDTYNGPAGSDDTTPPSTPSGLSIS